MELIEYGPEVIIEITPYDYELITRSSDAWRQRLKLKMEPLIIKPLGFNKYGLQARGVAGFIKIGNIPIEISPKFLNREIAGTNWRSSMWRFLAYGYGIETISESSGAIFNEDEGIADILADIFLTSMKNTNVLGYPLGYKTSHIDSSFVSGKLDPQRYSKILPVTGKIGIITTKLTQDIPVNRMLKWACNELLKIVESPIRRKMLHHWKNELPHVSSIPPRIEQINFSKLQYPHIVQALEIAMLLFDDKKIGYKNGERSLPGFLWDSDNLFERATRRLISEASRNLGINSTKRSHPLSEIIEGDSRLPSMITIPDIDVWSNNKSLFIADSKYKNLGKNPLNSDFYQILAVGRVCKVDTVALLYPSSSIGLTTQIYKPCGNSLPKTVFVTTIGLGSFSSQLQINLLRTKVTKWLSEAINFSEQQNLVL